MTEELDTWKRDKVDIKRSDMTFPPVLEEHEARPGRKQKRKRSERPENVRKKDQVWPPISTS